MKIELNLTAEEIFTISVVLNPIYNAKAIKREEKTWVSIGLDLVDKFDTKAQTLKKKQNLFDAKKKHKIGLKFHEADALEHILLDRMQYVDLPFMLHQIQKTIDFLNQKLA